MNVSDLNRNILIESIFEKFNGLKSLLDSNCKVITYIGTSYISPEYIPSEYKERNWFIDFGQTNYCPGAHLCFYTDTMNFLINVNKITDNIIENDINQLKFLLDSNEEKTFRSLERIISTKKYYANSTFGFLNKDTKLWKSSL